MQAPPLDLAAVYADSSPSNPVLFVLSPGADPMPYLLKLAKDVGIDDDQFHHISLGQGQGPVAARLIEQARIDGEWVCLQNCHLAVSWLPELERILDQTQSTTAAVQSGKPSGTKTAAPIGDVHPNFRLWLTSMPTSAFPVSILQNSIKVTNEPPKGVRANMLRTLADMDAVEYDTTGNELCVQEISTPAMPSKPLMTRRPSLRTAAGAAGSSTLEAGADATRPAGKTVQVYRKLLLGLSYFHALLQERRKFGSMGWNIPYAWMQSDLDVSKAQLKMYLQEALKGSLHTASAVPWDTLREMIGEVNYGGRVTDERDQRCVRAMLHAIFSPDILQDSYKLCGTAPGYGALPDGTLDQVKSFVNNLPLDEPPALFGLHANADVTLQLRESSSFIEAVIALQPHGHADSQGASSNSTSSLLETATAILAQLPTSVPVPVPAAAGPADAMVVDAMTVFLHQELERYSTLLQVVRSSLVELQKALKGQVVMSAALERLCASLLFNAVPALWHQAAYPSLKPLQSWVDDLAERIQCLVQWLQSGAPPCYWLPGFFFPQGFVTAVLQTHARNTRTPIDTLRISTHVLTLSRDQVVTPPATGAYIHGLQLHGAGWDVERGKLRESTPGQLTVELPVIWLEPVPISSNSGSRAGAGIFDCPVYKTSSRAGELSTTGHSTNFIMYLGAFLPNCVFSCSICYESQTHTVTCVMCHRVANQQSMRSLDPTWHSIDRATRCIKTIFWTPR